MVPDFEMGQSSSSIESSVRSSAYGSGRLAASSLARPIRQQFFPLNGTASNDRLPPPERIQTKDAIELDAVFHDARTEGTAQPPTVVVFHGNGCTLLDMAPIGGWYADRGFSVLLVTNRGYPGSSGDIVQAAEIFYDVQAVVSHLVLVRGVDRGRILVHGVRRNGRHVLPDTVHAGSHFTDAKDMINRVVELSLHGGTPSSASASASSPASLSSSWMESFALGVSHEAFKVGLPDALPGDDSFIEPDVPFRSDGLRNTSASVFVIYGERDQLMNPGFAKEFMLARYGADNVAAMTVSNTLMISGGHNDFFVYGEFGAYERYLRRL
ncbi:hypothetical protein HK405_012077, partial [Cladochytrium tenue]